MAQETRVDPQRLIASAGVCRDIRGGIGRMVTDAAPETESAITGLGGWTFRAALQELLDAQRDDMRRLGSRLDSTAEALERSAADYRRGDNAAAAHFRRADQPW